MLIDFFYALRAAKLPISVKELLTLLEALQAGVVGPNSPKPEGDGEATGYKIDDFYYLSPEERAVQLGMAGALPRQCCQPT